MPPILSFPDRATLMTAAADRLETALREGLEARGDACAALSGGATPEAAYRALAARDLPWPKISFGLVDERFVPPDHPASNEALLRRSLAPALAAGATLLPLFSAACTPAEAAQRADARYQTLHFDIALMGMGADGHTASWFAGAEGLNEALDPASARAVVAVRAPQAAGAADRLTLTLGAVARAEHVLLLVTGEEKRRRLQSALADSGDAAPVAALCRAAPSIVILWAPEP